MIGLKFEHGQRDDLASLHPGYFALVMATGIVAIATNLHGLPVVPAVLFGLNMIFLAVLLVAYIYRMRRYPERVVGDLRNHSRGVGYFTIAAAFGVVGSQLILQFGASGLAAVFWVAAAVAWVGLTYGIFSTLTVVESKPSLADGLNGGWLVSVVATQSVAIITVLVLGNGVMAGTRELLMFAALVLWLGGGALYVWLMTLIFFRYTFMRMSPADLTPPYWINMGAVAISTLAGATLVQHASLSPVVATLSPFMKGLTLLFWSVGTWWIPMLIVLGVWRYVLRGVPLRYNPLYWGGVFPLGMYSVCTYRLAEVLDTPFLIPVSEVFMVVAVVAWTATFCGLITSRLRSPAVTQ